MPLRKRIFASEYDLGSEETELPMTTSSAVVSQPIDLSPPRNPRRWIALAVVLVGTFVAALDFLIVSVAIPSIQHVNVKRIVAL